MQWHLGFEVVFQDLIRIIVTVMVLENCAIVNIFALFCHKAADLMHLRAHMLVQVALCLEGKVADRARVWPFTRMRPNVLLKHARFVANTLANMAHTF